MIVGVWNPKKRKAWKLLNAYVEVLGGQVRLASELRGARSDHLVFYGVDEVTRPAFEGVKHRRNFTYIDNGYFGSKYHGNKDPLYRITRGATQHSGLGTSDGRRFRSLGIRIEPWRRSGDHVLIALQSAWWFSRHHIDRAEWIIATTETVRQLTGRPVIVRDKPDRLNPGAPVSDLLAGCWCVVTHSSNVAVDAIVRGIPAIVLGASAARPMAGHKLGHVIEPPTPGGREQWAGVLADNQWTRAEIEKAAPFFWLEQADIRG